METEIKFVPTESQIENVVDSSLGITSLVMAPGEKAWIISNVKKQFSNAKIISAHLDTYNVEWVVKITK